MRLLFKRMAMLRMTFKTCTTLSVAVAGVGFAGLVAFTEPDTVCEFQPLTEYDNRLPASHVQNQCVGANYGEVSWVSWVSGRSLSYEFHYLDLLELLHGGGKDNDFSTPKGQ